MVVDYERQFGSPYLSMGNHPIRAIDADGNWVVLINFVDARASVEPFTGSGSFSLAIDDKGDIALLMNASLGVAVGEGDALGVSGTIYPTATIADLMGASLNLGVFQGSGLLEGSVEGNLLVSPKFGMYGAPGVSTNLGITFSPPKWGDAMGFSAYLELGATTPEMIITNIGEIYEILSSVYSDKEIDTMINEMADKSVEVINYAKKLGVEFDPSLDEIKAGNGN